MLRTLVQHRLVVLGFERKERAHHFADGGLRHRATFETTACVELAAHLERGRITLVGFFAHRAA